MPKNECSPNLVLIIQYSSSDMVVQGLKRFQAKHDHYFQSIELFYVSDLENETISESEIAKPLQQADIVLVDVRSNRITSSYLEKYLGDREETDIIFLLGMGLGTLNHRLGGFDLAKLIARFKHKDKPAESGSAQEADEPDIERFHEEIPERGVDLAFIQRMKDMTIKFGKILPFGAIKKMRHIMEMVSWWESGKIENFVCILELLASKYYDLHISRRQRQKPVESYDAAFWFPELGDLEIPISELLKRIRLDQDKRTIFVLFYGGYHFAHSSILIRELFEKYSSEWNIIPFYTDGISTTKYLNDFIDIDAPFDAVLSVLWFPLNGGPGGGRLEYTHKLFENWNVPVFNGIGLYNQLKEDYLETEEGLSPITTLASVIFPEMDGFSDSLPLIGTEEVDITLSNAAHRVVQPCLFRRNVELMMKRIDKRVHLQKKPNAKKRIALMLLNYPPGEDNIGSAAYFDGLRSLINILDELETDGYSVKIPEDCLYSDPGKLKDWLIQNGVVNLPRFNALKDLIDSSRANNNGEIRVASVSSDQFKEWYHNKLPQGLRSDVEKAWGKFPGKIHVLGDEIYLPIVKFGNIFVGLQPSRGDIEDIEKSYHDETLPPHYQYLAFYYFLQEELDVDAIVHMGTHGTLEFLPGKEIGLHTDTCYNFSMIDDVPHFYIYQVSNTSEGMIAKRRSLSTLVSYQTPAYTDTGLEKSFAEIEEKINLLEEARSMNNPSVRELETEIIESANKKGITADSVDEIADEVTKIKTSLIPDGLHEFGTGFNVEKTVEFIWNIQPMIPVHPNLYEIFGRYHNLSSDIIEDMGTWIRENSEDPLRDKIKDDAYTLITSIIRSEASSEISQMVNLHPFLEPISGQFNNLAEQIQKISYNLRNNDELKNLLRALDGKYVPVHMGGDPFRIPSILPTGYNLYQFNPQLIPTEMAMKRGKKAAEQTIELYLKQHGGKYPKNMMHVLWGFETAKTHGEAVGEILTYLGVRFRDLTSWKREPELIPLEELGRPRINVTIQICGFMRDLFSHVLDIIDDSIDLIIATDESADKNYVKEQYLELKDKELKAGVPEEQADFNGRVRIFGPKSSEYGSSLPTMLDSGSWDSEEELGKAWVNQMHYSYRKNSRAKPSKRLFKTSISSVDAISQVRDTVAYAVTDLDHYYEFVGGISQATKVAGKKKLPTIYITNTSNVKVDTSDIKTAINRGVVTRTANPKWVEGMLKHDYSGGKKVADRINYLLGFSATTQQVEKTAWDQVNNTFVENEEIRKKMKKNNIFAYHRSIETMLEAIKRGLWDATDDQIEKLKQLYLELEGLIES